MEPFRPFQLAPLNPTHQRFSFATTDTTYAPSTSGLPDHESEDDLPEEKQEHDEPENPPVAKTIAVQIFALLWLLPIAALLVLNIKQQVIGASAWCPFRHCPPGIYVWNKGTTGWGVAENAMALPAMHAKESRNILGSLQLAAKALEVWFILIATWLVYLTIRLLASGRSGLPVGYLTRPSEFANLPAVFDPLP